MQTKNSAITPASAAICERVLTIKKAYRLTFDTIAAEAGMSRSTVINQINGRFNLDIRVVVAVGSLCPDVSADYLLRGRGNITTTASSNSMEEIDTRIARLESAMKQVIDNLQYNKMPM